MNFRSKRIVPGNYVGSGEKPANSHLHKKQSAEKNIVQMLRMPYIDHNGVLQNAEKD